MEFRSRHLFPAWGRSVGQSLNQSPHRTRAYQIRAEVRRSPGSHSRETKSRTPAKRGCGRWARFCVSHFAFSERLARGFRVGRKANNANHHGFHHRFDHGDGWKGPQITTRNHFEKPASGSGKPPLSEAHAHKPREVIEGRGRFCPSNVIATGQVPSWGMDRHQAGRDRDQDTHKGIDSRSDRMQ